MKYQSNDSKVDSSQIQSPKKIRHLNKRWAIWLLLLLLFGPYLFFRATSFSRKLQIESNSLVTEPHTFDGKLKIATWNIAHGRGATDDNWEEGSAAKKARIREIAKQVKAFEADIVVLNEVDFSATWSGGLDQGTEIAQAAGFEYFIKQSNLDFGLLYGRWHFGNVVMSRYPIVDAKVVSLTPINTWEDWVVGCKRGVACTIELASKDRITVVGVHMEARGESVRVKQAHDLVEACSETDAPIFLVGDLNTTPGIAPMSRVDENGVNAFEILVQPQTGLSFAPNSTPTSDELTFPSSQPNAVIDWILYEDFAYKLVSQNVTRSLLSDHLPVIAEFEQIKR